MKKRKKARKKPTVEKKMLSILLEQYQHDLAYSRLETAMNNEALILEKRRKPTYIT